MRTLLPLTVTLLTLLAGCGGSADADDAAAGPPPSAPAPSADPATAHTVVESGFGREKGSNVFFLGALVRNDSPGFGQTVITSFDLLDPDGEVIGMAATTDQFSYPGEKLVAGTEVLAPRQGKLADVRVTVVVQPAGAGAPAEAAERLRFADTDIIGDRATSIWSVVSIVRNPTARPLRDAQIGVLCHDAKGRVIGGRSGPYPERIKSGLDVVTLQLKVSGVPTKCSLSGPAA